MKGTWGWMLGIGVVLSALAPAVQGKPTGDLESVISKLHQGHHLRIDARQQGRLQGPYKGRSGGNLVVQDTGGLREVDPANIERLWVRGKAAQTGALVGGVVGGISLGVLGAMASGLCESECEGATRELAITGGVLGLVSGGAVGGLVGLAIPKWHLRYSRDAGNGQGPASP